MEEEKKSAQKPQEEFITEERLKKAEAYIEEEEGPSRRLVGRMDTFITAVAVVMSLIHLYAAVGIIMTQILRGIHVMFALFLIFLVFPSLKRFRNRILWYDYLLSVLSVACIVYTFLDFEEFIYRSVTPTILDLFFGSLLIFLVLEATRRTTSWILPCVVGSFLVYAYVGPWLPAPWTHRGYGMERLVGHMYMTLEGIFGVPIDVSSTFIILFTIYGAFLEYSGAGKFFIDFSLTRHGREAHRRRPDGDPGFFPPGRSLRKRRGNHRDPRLGGLPHAGPGGYSKEAAGGLLSAGGIGAILSPPVLGAAAFLIAEFLKISYLDVIVMSIIPTILFYWAIFLMVEFDAKKFGAKVIAFDRTFSLWQLTLRYGFHFTSLIAIVAIMVVGFTPMMAVFWSTVIAFAVSFIRPETAIFPRKLISALRAGSIGVLSVAATCASAGIIVGVVTLTGLGLKFSSIVIDYAGGSLLLTAVFTAMVVWVIGLAVPVTASYIICAVIAAPALIKLGVPDYAAHMFIFYYSILSEVSPPTALSPFAAAALTGGDPYKTTIQAWKYTLPAFLVPFNFTLHPDGVALLLKGDPFSIFWTFVTALVGIFALAAGMDGWMFKEATWYERIILVGAGVALVYPSLIFDVSGLALVAVAALSQKVLRKTNRNLTPAPRIAE